MKNDDYNISFRIVLLLIEYDNDTMIEKERKVFFNHNDLKNFLKYKTENNKIYSYKVEKINQSFFSFL